MSDEIEHERIPPEPPRIDADRLDFSQFHPLDHWLVQCRGYPGGWRRHLRDRWLYQWSHTLHGLTLCRFGRHRIVDAWKYHDGVPHHYRTCGYCLYRPDVK